MTALSREAIVAHGCIQSARGALTDGDLDAADKLLAAAVWHVKELEAERDRYRAALMGHRPPAARRAQPRRRGPGGVHDAVDRTGGARR